MKKIKPRRNLMWTSVVLCTLIAPLRDVMGQAWRHDPCDPCHAATLGRCRPKVKNREHGVPGIPPGITLSHFP